MPAEPQEPNKEKIEEPEFLLIDDRGGKETYTYFGKGSSRTSQESPYGQRTGADTSKKNPSLRFFSFLGLLFCLIFGCGIFLWSCAMTFLSFITLFQNPRINREMVGFWKISWNTLMAALFFAVGILFPALGLALFVFYFSLASGLNAQEIFQKVMNRPSRHGG